MVAVKSAIQGSADHTMTRKFVTGHTVIRYIQEYRKEEGTIPRVATLKTLVISMMDIQRPTTGIQGHKGSLFYITRQHDPTRENPSCIDRRGAPI